MKSRNRIKRGQVEDAFAVRDEENTFTETNEFTKPLKVADGVDDRDAVNKSQINAIQPSFARFGEDLSGYTIGVEKVVEFTTTVFVENIDLSVVNSNKNIKINTTGYYVITGIVNSGYSPNQNITYASIYKNTGQLGSGQSQGQGGGITVGTGVVFLEQNDLLEMRVEVSSAVSGGAYLSIQKIK